MKHNWTFLLLLCALCLLKTSSAVINSLKRISCASSQTTWPIIIENYDTKVGDICNNDLTIKFRYEYSFLYYSIGIIQW